MANWAYAIGQCAVESKDPLLLAAPPPKQVPAGVCFGCRRCAVQAELNGSCSLTPVMERRSEGDNAER